MAGLALTACNGQAQLTATPTETLRPIDTPLATLTPTPAPTDTPRPTNTPKPSNTPPPTVKPTLALGELQHVEEGGFSFRAPLGYDVDVQGSQVGVFDKAGTIIISVIGVTANQSDKSPEGLIDEFLNEIAEQSSGDLKKETSYTVTIAGIEGVAFDVTGTLFGSPLRGQTVLVLRSPTQFLFGLGIANTGLDKKRWDNEGSRAFNALLSSIEFTTARSTGSCVISTDNTYGYTQENPIKVGGGAFGGPSRERAYLDNLRGPNGEELTYERTGSVPFGDIILDIYEIKGLAKSITLYLDEYNYTDPKAPVGFTCVSAFPLAKP